MKRFTVSIPEDLKEGLDSMKDINWPDVVKEGIKEKLFMLEKFQKFESKGEL